MAAKTGKVRRRPGTGVKPSVRLIVNGVPLRFSRRVTVHYPDEFTGVVRYEKRNNST